MINIDCYAYSNNLKRVHPLEKFLFTLLNMILCLTSPNFITPLIVLGVMTLIIIVKAGIPIKAFINLLAVPLSFLLISILTITFSISSDPSGFAMAYSFSGLTLGVRYPDFLAATHLFLKSLGAVSSLYFLALTTPITEIISILHKLKVPKLITELMVLIYRFLFVFMDTATTIRRAQSSRLGYISMRSSYQSISRLFLSLLGKVFVKSQDLYNSMGARCYSGEINVLTKRYPVNFWNYFKITAFGIPLILLNLLGRS